MNTIYQVLQLKGVEVEHLLKAISSEEGFRSWWTTGTHMSGDGVFEFRFSPDYHKVFRASTVEARKRSYLCTGGAPEWIGTRMEFEIEPGEEGCVKLHFRHTGWKEQSELFGICSYHWALYLWSLEKYLRTGKGEPTEY